MSTAENATPKPLLYKTIEVLWSKLAETLNAEADAGYHVCHDFVRSVHDPNSFQVLLRLAENQVRDKAMALVSQLVDAAPAYIENLLAGLPQAPPADAPPAEDPPAAAATDVATSYAPVP